MNGKRLNVYGNTEKRAAIEEIECNFVCCQSFTPGRSKENPVRKGKKER